MRVDAIMKMKKEALRLRPEDSCLSAARIMLERNTGFLPVCDRMGVVIGVLTDRDIVLRVTALDLAPGTVPVERVMSREVVVCRPDDDLRRAEALMATHRKARLPVCDEEGRLLGVISLSDVAQADRSIEVGAVLREVTARESPVRFQ